MKNLVSYGGIFFQLLGLLQVTLCLFSGIQMGDYGQMELRQFLAGIFLFFLGHLLRKRATSS